MSCQRCGRCCFPYSVGMDADDDAGRWLVYHGLIVQDLDEGRMAIHGHSRCAMLLTNGDGTTACAVYESRPRICADFSCARSRQ